MRKSSAEKGAIPRGAILRLSTTLLLVASLSRPALPDVITLRNGEVLKGKIVKETNGIVKLRMPRKGKIITTFLNRGTIVSIVKSEDEVNRAIFKEAGVRNPARDFHPVYYPGPATAIGGGGRGKKLASRTTSKKTKKRGVEARRERFKSGLSRGREKTEEKASTTGRRPSSSTSAGSTSPTTTGSATTTTSGSSTSIFR